MPHSSTMSFTVICFRGYCSSSFIKASFIAFFVKEGIGTTPYRYMYIIICILYPPCAAQSTARAAETGGDHITSPRFFVRFMVKSKEKAVLI